MEKFRGRAHALPDKDDASTFELLPSESLPDRPSVRHGEDSVQEAWHNQTPAIKGWPQTPKPLKKKWQRKATLAVDMIIALVPLFFIVLSITTIRISGSPTSSGGHRVKSATTLGPTLFPVTFAAIVGRSLKALASYQAERGAKLGRLEQMIGSLTMFGAIELQVLLRTFDLVGVSLVSLWALSPLGGQASLRLLDTGVERAMTVQTLRYLNPDSLSILGTGADTFEALGFILNSLYLSALLIPPAGQAASMDTWGNIKIPRIEHLAEGSQSDVDGWFTVSAENASYSSLVGLPIAGIPTAGSSSFSVQSYYMIASCTNASGSVPYPGVGGFTVNVTGGSSINWPLFPYQQPYPDVEPRIVSFESGSVASDFAFTTQCTLTRSSVEANVTCAGRSCGVTHIRRSKFDQRPPGYTPLYSTLAAPMISSAWPTCANSVHHPDYSTPTEYFLSDPTLKGLSGANGGISLIGMPADVFSERFSLLLNTYWQCSLVPWYLTGNFPTNESLPSDVSGDVDGAFNTTTVTITNVTDIYICNKTWATILLVASSVLLLFGLYGAIVKHCTRGPRVLGYVSSMTRDNPYVNLPPGGCALDGLERARLLKDVEVKLRDVAPRHGVGHIALSDARPFDSTERFAFGRLYADAYVEYSGAPGRE